MASTSTDRVRGVNAGKAIKVPCKVASTVNLTLSGEQTIDGVSCTAGDRVLVKDQNEAEENGIYEVATSEWRRTPDWDGETDVTQGTQVNVNQGTINENTIWRVSTEDPISTGTTEVTLSLTSRGDVGPIEADVDDLQNRVSILETNTEVPDPDPEPTPDPGSTYFWNVVINDNTTFANVYVYDYTGDAWIIVRDDDTTPTDDSVGATPPTGFTSGAVAATYDMGSYTSGTLYFYQWIEGSGILEKLDVYGVSGILVTPNDTVNPVATLTGVKSTTEPYTEVDYTLTASDAHSGIDESRTQAFSNTTLQPITAEGIAALTGGVGTETLTFNEGAETDVFFRVWDNNNNYIDTLPVSVNLDDPVDTTAGIMTIDETANPIEAITQAESTTPLTVTVNLTGNSDGFAKTATIKLRKWTCETSVQVDTALPASGVVTITPPATQGTIDIVVADVDSTENNRFEAYIDTTGAPGGGSAPAIGTNGAIYAGLTGTGGGTGTSYELTVDKPGAGDYFGYIDADENWSLTADANGKFYTRDASYAACIADGGVDDSVINDGAGGGAGAGTAPADCFHMETGGYTNTTTNGAGSFLDAGTETAQATVSVDFPVTADYYFWLRQSRSSANLTTYLAIDGAEPTASDEFIRIDHALDVWDFSPLGRKNTDINTPIAKTITAGVHTVAICAREASASLYWNRLHITTDSTHDPSAAGTGPNLSATTTEPEATLPTGVVTDNPDNPTELPPIGAIPAATLTPTLFPLNGADETPTSLILSFSYGSDVTGLRIYEQAISVTSNGSPVSGSWTTNVNTATFTDTAGNPILFSNAATVVVTASDTETGILYDAGVKKGIDLGTWSFTTEAASGASQFANVPLQSGSMDFAWYNTAIANYTTGTDDPVSWPALYAAALNVVPVANQLDLQSALNTAQPGDFIMLSGNQPVWDILSTIQVTRPGTSANPIVICPEQKALGTSGPVTFANGSVAMQLSIAANWNIIGGFTWQNISRKAIELVAGPNTTTNGATDVRITDNIFDSIGRSAGSNDGLVKFGDRCHRFRFDHNAVINSYNNIRIKYDVGSEISATKDASVDHNYFGPVGTDELAGVTYEIAGVQTIGNVKPDPTDDDLTLTVEYNAFEILSRSSVDQELMEIKTNGATIQNNICYGTRNNHSISLRQSHNSTVDSNYCMGVGAYIHGENNSITNNLFHCNSTANHGIRMLRTGRFNPPLCSKVPGTTNTTIDGNTILDPVQGAAQGYGIRIGDDQSGCVNPVTGNTIINNVVKGGGANTTLGHFDTTNEPNNTLVLDCAGATVADTLGGLNSGNTFTDNYVENTGSATVGNLMDQDSAPPPPVAEAGLGTTLTYVA